jgi:hypothetical protein
MDIQRTSSRRLALAMWFCIAAIGAIGTSAQATSNYSYAKDEYVTIANGAAPDHRYAVAAHGGGELGDVDFHLYLMAEPGHRVIGPLEEVKDILDTGPTAYTAEWSADSRYVALLYRSDRHITAMNLYRIEHGRAYPISGPTPLPAIVGRFDLPDLDVRSRSFEMNWLGPKRFILKEKGIMKPESKDVARRLGPFARPDPSMPDSSDFVEFSAAAECELISGDRYRIVELKPG